MSQIKVTHAVHESRKSRNIGVGVSLAAFVVLVLGLTVVKVQRGDTMQAFDHVARPELEAAAEAGQ